MKTKIFKSLIALVLIFLLISSSTYTVLASSLSLSTTRVRPGENISVTFSGFATTDHGWIGFYREGADDRAFLSWRWLRDLTNQTFTVQAPKELGAYNFRIFRDSGFTRLGLSASVQVVQYTPTFRLTRTNFQPNEQIVVSYSDAPIFYHAWIGFFRANAEDRNFGAWTYLKGNTSGTFTVTAPNETGQFNFRIFLDGGYTRVGVSENITVGAAPVAPVRVTSVTVSPTSASINIGTTRQLAATVAPANATNRTVTWSSSHPAIARVDANGLVTGVATGTATITVTTADGNFRANTTVIVSQQQLVTSRIAFVRSVDGGLDIFSMNADGTDQRNLTNYRDTDRNPVWSPDGTRIAFLSRRDFFFSPWPYQIYVMNTDGTNQLRLTSPPSDNRNPSWSPDSRMIAFQSNRDGNYEIYVMNADGTNQRRLTTRTGDDLDPVWSPDGTKIAYRAYHDRNSEIHVMNADGSNQQRLTNTPAADWMPRWSPDGTRIAFMSHPVDRNELFIMNSDGTNQRQLTFHSGWLSRAGSFDWSPDSSKITFSSIPAVGAGGFWQIRAMNVDGTNEVVLASNQPHHNFAPTWSPDGRMIAFYSSRDGGEDIFVVNADGTNQRNITNTGGMNRYPVWSPLRATQQAPIRVTGITVAPASASINIGATRQLAATVAPANATNRAVTWSSSHPAIARVDANGLVTGVATGTATITVTTADGNFRANSTITVTAAVPTPPAIIGAEAFRGGVRLTWQETAGLGYRLFRSTEQGVLGISVTDFFVTGTSFADVNVEPNTTYFYTIKPVLAEARPLENVDEVLGPAIHIFTVRTGAAVTGTDRQRQFIKLRMESPNMSVNGVTQEVDPGRGTTPITIAGRTMIPIRAVVEAMGGQLRWDAATQKVTLIARGNTVEMWLNRTDIRINGVDKKMDVAPVVREGRTFVPVRFAAENLGSQVDWISSTREIVIIFD